MNAPVTLVEPGTVRLERLLPGPVERVWAYLTDGPPIQTLALCWSSAQVHRKGR